MKGKNNKVLIPVKGKSALYCLGREYIEKEVISLYLLVRRILFINSKYGFTCTLIFFITSLAFIGLHLPAKHIKKTKAAVEGL